MNAVTNEVPQARTTVYAPLDMIRRLKAKLALKGMTLAEWFRQKVAEELAKE